MDPHQDEVDEFRDSTRRVGEFKSFLFCPQENYKDACESDDQMKQDSENDKLFEVLPKAKLDLRLDLDIQNFEIHCYLVNSLLNENNLLLQVYELKDKFTCLIKQDGGKRRILRELSVCVVE